MCGIENLPQLRMIWPENLISHPPEVNLPSGYSIRVYLPGDDARFFEIMELAGWDGWNEEMLQPWLAKILPDGWFMVIDEKTDEIVATAMALHNYKGTYPFWGDLGWLAVDPGHGGKGLGLNVSAAVTSRFIEGGYRKIQLFTEDYRLPALKTYLKLGYIPSLYTGGMLERWEAICTKLDWQFTPNRWDS